MTEITDIVDIAEATGDIKEKAGMGIQLLQAAIPSLVAFGLSVVGAILILLIGRKVIQLLMKLIQRSFERANLELSLRKFLSAFIHVALYVLLIFLIAGTVGINTASIVALLGSAALAIGMSLQGSLSNFAGSVLILLTHPFRVGDVISSSYGDGQVRMIGLVYTEIVTADNRLITIPNGSLSGAAITNITAFPKRRLDIAVGISYSADIAKAKELFLGAMQECPFALNEPDAESKVFVDSLQDSAVSLLGVSWVKPAEYLDAKFWITEEVKKRFDANGIEIPFNQLDVHVQTV